MTAKEFGKVWTAFWKSAWGHIKNGMLLFFYLAAALGALKTLQAFGFQLWTIQEGIDAAKAFSWPHALIVVTLILVAVFADALRHFLKRVERMRWGKGGVSVGFREYLDEFNAARTEVVVAQVEAEELEINPEHRATGRKMVNPFITIDDVKQAYQRIALLDKGTIENDSQLAYGWLMRQGINTKEKLDAFVSADHVFRALAKIYVSELKRDPNTPLDTTAVSIYGVWLYQAGISPNSLTSIVSELRYSPEWSEKNR